jgi:hypothetical protein
MKSKFLKKFFGVDVKANICYICYICYIFQVIEIANLDGLSKGKAYSFFNEVIYPFAVKVYQETHCGSCPVPESGESLIVNLLVQCVSQYQIPLEQVNNFYHTLFFI